MKGFVLGLLLAFGTSGAVAQSIEELQALANERGAELQEYRLLIQNAGPDEQRVMVRALLKSEDGDLQSLGRDFALFSQDPVLRNELIRSILDSRRTLHVSFESEGEFPENLREHISGNSMGGTVHGSKGSVVHAIPEPSKDVANFWSKGDKSFRLAGDTISFDGGNGQWVATLQDDGMMRGSFSLFGRFSVPIEIDLRK